MTEPFLVTTAQPCEVHRDHRPNSHVNHRHHVWPQGEGGPDVPGNVVVICPTGHENVHSVLRLLKRHGGNPARYLLAGYAREEIRLARLGFDRMQRQHL